MRQRGGRDRATPRAARRAGGGGRPGRVFSATVALRFPAAPAGIWRDRLVVPEGWNTLSPADLAFTPASADEVRLIGVAVPRTAPEGTYILRYVLAAEADPGRELARAEFTLTVPGTSALAVEPQLSPERAIAGEPLTLSWRVVNRGNQTAVLALTARSSGNFAVHLSPGSLELAPGRSGLVTAEVAPPATLRREQSHATILEMEIAEGARRRAQSAVISTLVLPRFTTAEESDDGFAVSLRTRGAYRKSGSTEASALQSELSGGGFLDAEHARRLDLLLRSGPLGTGAGLLPREQYSVAYHDRWLDLLLGDQSYALSPLTQRWLFGRGAGFEFRQGPLTTGMYSATTPWLRFDTRQTAAYVQLDPVPSLRLRGNLLVQDTAERAPWSDPHSLLPSLQLTLQPDRLTTLELEGAVSDNDEHPRDTALRGRFRGRLGRDLYVDLEAIRAGPDFFGYYRDLLSTSGNLAWQITPDWRARTSFQQSESNLDLDPERGTASRVRTWTAGVERRLSPRLSVAVDAHAFSLEQRLRRDQPDFDQDTAALTAQWSTGAWSIRASAEGGWTRLESAPGGTHAFRRLAVFALARPSAGKTHSLYLSTGDSRYNPRPQRETEVVAASTWDFNNGFRLRAAASYHRANSGAVTEDAAAEGQLAYDFRNGASIELGLRFSGVVGDRRDRAAALTYTVPLRARSVLHRRRGSLDGTIELPSPEGPRPVAGAVLRIAHLQAASGRAGRFVFPLLKAGRYTLSVDAPALGPGRVLSTSRPLEVVVERGQRTHVRLEVVLAARVEGRIGAFAEQEPPWPGAEAPPPPLQFTHGLSQVLIEARGPDGAVRRTVTDEWGRFTFDRLVPGDWTLLIDEHAVPPRHRLEQGVFALRLEPGQTRTIEARVVPVHRPIRMLDAGWIGSAGTPRTQASAGE